MVLGAVVIDSEPAVVDKALERSPLIREIPDGIAQGRFRQHGLGERLALGIDAREHSDRLFLAKCPLRVGLEVGGGLLDLIELLNEGDHPGGRAVGHERLHEASPGVRPAANFHDAATLIQGVVARVGIRLECPPKACEKRLRAVTLVRGRRIEEHLAVERIQIGPEPTLETATTRVEHRDAGVVGLPNGPKPECCRTNSACSSDPTLNCNVREVPSGRRAWLSRFSMIMSKP